jgi:hypothetical protein
MEPRAQIFKYIAGQNSEITIYFGNFGTTLSLQDAGPSGRVDPECFESGSRPNWKNFTFVKVIFFQCLQYPSEISQKGFKRLESDQLA